MAMTNEMIIFNAQMELMAKGKIGTTGRMMTMQFEDGERTIPEPEPIHTFQHWKECGYKVRKGEHAVAQLMIWKYTGDKNESEEQKKERGHCFLKKSFFFAASQVERMCQE